MATTNPTICIIPEQDARRNGGDYTYAICQHCQKKFRSRPYAVRAGTVKYCSRFCKQRGWNRPLAEKFWEKVDKSGDCWIWTAGRHRSGYGKFTIYGERTTGAHRISYELSVGPIPEGMFVCHKCDNPPCVNPDHLFLGTPKDNAQDRVKKGRAFRGTMNWQTRHVKGEKHHNAKLNAAMVRWIRIEYAHGRSQEAIAQELGVHQTTVACIINGSTWAHVG